MSADRRFFSLNSDNSIFKFEIDTRFVQAGATDGSENPLTFKLPFFDQSTPASSTACIVRVSDGRPDISIIGNVPKSALTLTFSSAGIYEIAIIGKTKNFGFYYSKTDKKKITRIKRWGNELGFAPRAFFLCENLVIDASNTLILPEDSSWFFEGIKGILTPLTLLDTSKVSLAWRILTSIQYPLDTVLNPFWKNITLFQDVYSSNTFSSSVNLIEIISDSIINLTQPFNALKFQNVGAIRIVCKTPNLKKMFRVFYTGDVKTRCHAGEIDVRNVTDPTDWLFQTFAIWQVDETLKGWAKLPFMQAGVVWDWNNSKYSNTPEVVAAYNKITQQWGVVFNRLTMA